MKTLDTPRALGSATRWRVEDAQPIERDARMVINVQLLRADATLVSEVELNIRNGMSDGVVFDVSAPRISALLARLLVAVSTPTGYTDAVAAWRSGGTMAARRDAIETWMLQAGVAAANMAGT